MKRMFFFVPGLLVPVLCLFAQSSLHRLSVGDFVPDLRLDSQWNSSLPSAKLSDLGDDLVLLDQWSTSCGSCIELFPYLDSLQEEFTGRFRVFLLNIASARTGDTPGRIQQALARLEKRIERRLTLPVIYANPVLDELFPCTTIPQDVWIQKGKVIAITGSSEVTRNNVRAILEGTLPPMHNRHDRLDFRSDAPLFIKGNGDMNVTPLHRSLITGYLEGIGHASGLFVTEGDSLRAYSGSYVHNATLIDLLRGAWRDGIAARDNRIVNRSSYAGLITDYADTSIYRNSYCYELITSPCNLETINRYMREDIERYFKVRISDSVISRPCWVLSRDPSRKLPKQNKHEPSAAELFRSAPHKFLRNFPHESSILILDEILGLPLIDETNDNDPFTIQLPSNVYDTTRMIAAFKAAGYLLATENRPVQVTIIDDY